MADHTDFGSVATTDGSVVRTFTIENLGDAELKLDGTPLVALNGTHAEDFTVTALPTTPIASGRMTTFQVSFDPSGSGLRTATLTIANDDDDENPYDFQIQGTGTTTATAEIDLRGNTLSIGDGDTSPTTADHTDFGSTNISGGTVVRTFTIENVGSAALNLAGTPRVALSGTHPDDFQVTALPTTPIASGRMTTFQVRFDPSSLGLRTAMLTIVNDDADEDPYEFQIQGTGIVNAGSEIDVRGNTLSIGDGDTSPTTADHTDFGSTDIFSGTVLRTFTIANTGSAALHLDGTPLVALSGTHPGDFQVTALPTTPIVSGGMTTFQVRFDPSGLGLRTATLTIVNDDADENPYTFQIQGTGTATQFLTVNIAAASFSEGAGAGATTATVSRTTATTNSLTVTLASSDTSEATVPTTVTFPAGQTTSTPFNIAAVNDTIVDGTQTVTITASATNHVPGADTVDVTDDDTTMLDFGDAPTAAQSGFTKDYPVTLAQDGARHTKSSLFLGSLIDVESDGQPASEAGASGSEGDDNIGEDDEDGVFATASIVANSASSAGSSISVTASGSGKLDAWIDFNRDADWDDDGEQIFASEDVVAGANLLSFRVPAGATPGVAVARFRLSSVGGLAPTGAASDGEVEDDLITILNGDVPGGVAVEVDAAVPGTVEVVADGNDVVVRSGAIELFRGAGIALNRLDILGTDGDDTFNIADLDAIFAGLVGGDAGAGNDTLRLTGSGQTLDLAALAAAHLQGIEAIDITGGGGNTLTLDVNKVLSLSSTTDTLRVQHDDGDAVHYGSGWTVQIPQIVGGQYVHILKQGNATIEVANTRPFNNPLRELDTNRDGVISPVDALIVINRIIDQGSGPLAALTSVAGLTEFFYIDTSGDRSVSPLDALVVINFLNDPTGVAEGEFAPSLPTPVVSSTAHIASERTAVGGGISKRRLPSLDLLTTTYVQHAPAVDTFHIEGSRLADRRSSDSSDKELVDAIDEFFAVF
jgi:hypothetical protein